MSWNTERKLSVKGYAPGLSTDSIFSSLSAATMKGNVAPLGVSVKSLAVTSFFTRRFLNDSLGIKHLISRFSNTMSIFGIMERSKIGTSF